MPWGGADEADYPVQGDAARHLLIEVHRILRADGERAPIDDRSLGGLGNVGAGGQRDRIVLSRVVRDAGATACHGTETR
jgi:hypothetical protein